MADEDDFSDLLQRIRARRAALGITELDDEACRNTGRRRTADKRAFLQRIAQRCREAGVEPLKAAFEPPDEGSSG